MRHMPKTNTVYSSRTCPKCRSRATKIFHLNGDHGGYYECQVCGHFYLWPEGSKHPRKEVHLTGDQQRVMDRALRRSVKIID
jgi:transposase